MEFIQINNILLGFLLNNKVYKKNKSEDFISFGNFVYKWCLKYFRELRASKISQNSHIVAKN